MIDYNPSAPKSIFQFPILCRSSDLGQNYSYAHVQNNFRNNHTATNSKHIQHHKTNNAHLMSLHRDRR